MSRPKKIEKCGECPKWAPNWCPILAKHASANTPACEYADRLRKLLKGRPARKNREEED